MQADRLAHNLDGLPDTMQRVLVNRGITELTELDFSKHSLASYHQLKGIQEAVELLYEHISLNHSIVIVGDYDADGATSTALALRFFAALNYEHIQFIVPNRLEDGYGLTTNIVKKTLRYQPKLIITVDNGISSLVGIDFCREQRIDVLVTDHHLPASSLPRANVIVNPNQPGCEFVSKNLAGVGVIFYVLCALRSYLKQQGYLSAKGITNLNMADYLDLVALGTIADVVPLDHNNRVLVQQGLANIRMGRCISGICALANIAKKDLSKLTTSDLAYSIAPKLNAAGRLDDMSIGIQCLLAKDYSLALALATKLNSLNQQRKVLEANAKQQAQIAIDDLMGQDIPNGICLYNHNWHEGIIGILAGRIKEKYARPTIIFTSSSEENVLKGSARSIPGIHIKDLLESISCQEPGLLQKFGGHAMAAGLSIDKANLAAFKAAYLQKLQAASAAILASNVLTTDGELDFSALDLDLAKQLAWSLPWGQGFPEPLFDNILLVKHMQVIHDVHYKFVFVMDDARTIEGIAFNLPVELQQDYTDRKVRIVYRVNINNFNQHSSVQLMIEQIQLAYD